MSYEEVVDRPDWASSGPRPAPLGWRTVAFLCEGNDPESPSGFATYMTTCDWNNFPQRQLPNVQAQFYSTGACRGVVVDAGVKLRFWAQLNFSGQSCEVVADYDRIYQVLPFPAKSVELVNVNLDRRSASSYVEIRRPVTWASDNNGDGTIFVGGEGALEQGLPTGTKIFGTGLYPSSVSFLPATGAILSAVQDRNTKVHYFAGAHWGGARFTKVTGQEREAFDIPFPCRSVWIGNYYRIEEFGQIPRPVMGMGYWAREQALVNGSYGSGRLWKVTKAHGAEEMPVIPGDFESINGFVDRGEGWFISESWDRSRAFHAPHFGGYLGVDLGHLKWGTGGLAEGNNPWLGFGDTGGHGLAFVSDGDGWRRVHSAAEVPGFPVGAGKLGEDWFFSCCDYDYGRIVRITADGQFTVRAPLDFDGKLLGLPGVTGDGFRSWTILFAHHNRLYATTGNAPNGFYYVIWSPDGIHWGVVGYIEGVGQMDVHPIGEKLIFSAPDGSNRVSHLYELDEEKLRLNRIWTLDKDVYKVAGLPSDQTMEVVGCEWGTDWKVQRAHLYWLDRI